MDVEEGKRFDRVYLWMRSRRSRNILDRFCVPNISSIEFSVVAVSFRIKEEEIQENSHAERKAEPKRCFPSQFAHDKEAANDRT